MDKDALTRRADFRCTDGVGNRLTEHFDVLSVCLPDQRVDLSAIVGAVICHRQQDTHRAKHCHVVAGETDILVSIHCIFGKEK